jgi:hypothetical protein
MYTMKKMMLMMFLMLGIGTWASAQNTAGPKIKSDCSTIITYNSASKVIHIEVPDVNVVTHVEILSKNGQVLYDDDLKNNPEEISISDWYQGIYYVVAVRPNGSSMARIIKT